MADMNFETDIIIRITVGMIDNAVILAIMHGETIKSNNIVYIGNVIMCLTSVTIIFSISVSSNVEFPDVMMS